MRGTRWLLLVAIAAIVAGVGITYRARKMALQEQAPARPKPLPEGINSAAEKYEYRATGARQLNYEVTADYFQQVAASSQVELKGVRLKLYNAGATEYDLVTSAAATFDPKENKLYSEGEAEITLALPVAGAPKGTPVSIRSSGVTCDTTSGLAETERETTFAFENGEGQATGARYDPMGHEILLKSAVELRLTPQGPHAKPMKIEASSLVYKEDIAEIWLKPWGRLTRENTVVEGNEDIIRLGKTAEGRNYLRQIEALRATGSDAYPNRKLRYSADGLLADLTESGEIQKVTATGNAQLLSTSATSETAIKADRVEMNFEISGNDSLLTRVYATGKGEAQSRPLPANGRALPETHVLRSEVIEMKMRPGGQTVESVVTHAPGRLELLPNQPVQRSRALDGERIAIAYADANAIESFRATNVKTRTEPNAEERKRNRAVFLTASREMIARFDPKTNRMVSMEQNGDFTYEEGPRRARASRATLDSAQDLIVLETGARMWDPSGSTTADRIRMDQRTGDFTAEGGVNSSRVPEKSRDKGSSMLSGDEPLQAQARRMESKDQNRLIHYEGGAVMWQGANRIQADAIDIDRRKSALVASGNVTTKLWDAPKDGPADGKNNKKAPQSPVLTVVQSQKMVYTDQDRLAHYTGGVALMRGPLRVKGAELRAFLAESGGGSQLDKAFADGDVQIVQASPQRTRTGTGTHAEFYAVEQRVVLRGSKARLIDSLKGVSDGDELTYYVNDDRLLITGAPQEPVRSRIKRKRQ